MAESVYYPPRARWYTRFLSRRPVGRFTGWAKLFLPGDISIQQCLWSIVAPGYAFSLRGLFPAWPVLTFAYILALIGFLAWLGYPFGNGLYIFAIIVHASSIIQLTGLLLVDSSFRVRFVAAIGVVFIMLIGVYWPLLHRMEEHWFMPVRDGNNVVVINRAISFDRVRPGEVVAYMLPQTAGNQPGEPGIYFAGGVGLVRVQGVAGDRIEFFPDSVQVNGRSVPRAAMMPVEGMVVVPQKHWFIWPRYDITVNNGVQPAALSRGLMAVSMVSAEQYRGRPYASWFGRRQQLP